tara:strand:+ start:391 stop:1308 length:918 start_codon:yes stop_codon:yes gene_type:complete
MNSLKSEFLNIESFENLTKKLMSKKTIDLAKTYIEETKSSFFVKPRDLLSAFMVYKFPDDSIGSSEVEVNKNVIKFAKLFIECEESERKSNLVKYIHHFKLWKKQDLETLQEQLFNEYHQLTVDIVNTDDPDKKHVFETVQKEIEECAFRVGGNLFVNKIKSYAPVLLNIDELKNQYTQAHYDLICQQFDEGNYDKIKGIFTFVKNVCKQLNKEDSTIDEVLDVDFIITRLQNKSYNKQELLNLFDYMFTLIRNIQSSQHDQELEMFTKEMHNEDIYIPKILFKMVDFIKQVVSDLENIKEKYNE